MRNGLIEYLPDLFADFGAVAARPMFGGHGIYREGVLIGIVLDETLYLKVDAQTRPAFEAAGCVPCIYTRQRTPITMSYWSVPEGAMDSAQAMLPWARLAHGAALRKSKAARPRSGSN
jgi:DNA transformation protein and related proteins